DTIAFAERLERFDNALRVLQNMPADKPVPDVNKVVVYRYGDTRTIGQLAGSMGVAGFYIPRPAYPVAFTPAREYVNPGSKTRVDERIKMKPETVLFHEYTHHFMLNTFPTTYPSWYIEGFAEANSTIDLRPNGSFLVGLPANHRSIELFNMQQLHVAKLLDPNFKYADFQDAVQKYSVGWLLTHYLTFAKSRPGQLKTYLKLLADGKPGLDAAKEAFGDLDKLNGELVKYKSTNLPAAEVIPPNYQPPKVTIQLVEPAFAAKMIDRVQVSRGITRAKARSMSPGLSQTAAAAPANLQLQLLAAEAALDAQDFPAATVAAERAMKIDSKSPDAMIFRARALTEAKEGPADRFKVARILLAKARNLDKADPRPLIEYYMSYRRAPERPIPEAAAFALDDAYDMARHDHNFRLVLTRQLLEENRPKPAAQVLAPLAYSFDGRDQERNYAGKAMTRLLANDTAGALEIIRKELAKIEEPKEDK
ncbi:MAG: hypothetical protein ACKOPO_10090, partial [Novosphingobium sp.]